MTDHNTVIRPQFSLLSFTICERNSAYDAIDYENHDLVSYIGPTQVGFEKVGKAEPALPQMWQACIKRCYKLQARSLVGKYTSYRYLICFDQNNVERTNQLLFGDERHMAASELARSLVVQPMTGNVRPNRFTIKSPIDFAMITLVDVPDLASDLAAGTPALVPMTLEDATRLAQIVRHDIGQEGGSAFPSRFADLVFSVGGVVGAPFDSAVVGRLNGRPQEETQTLVPAAVMDWLNFVDRKQVVDHLTKSLQQTELGNISIKDYIDRILAAHGEAEYEERYLKPREASLAQRIEFTELNDELARELKSNVFLKRDPSYFQKIDADPRQAGIDFSESVTSAFTNSAKKFDVVKDRIKSRDERLSEYLRDVVGWRLTQATNELGRNSLSATQASNRLAERMEKLTKWLLLLAVLTVLAALPTDEIKKEIYGHLFPHRTAAPAHDP